MPEAPWPRAAVDFKRLSDSFACMLARALASRTGHVVRKPRGQDGQVLLLFCRAPRCRLACRRLCSFLEWSQTAHGTSQDSASTRPMSASASSHQAETRSRGTRPPRRGLVGVSRRLLLKSQEPCSRRRDPPSHGARRSLRGYFWSLLDASSAEEWGQGTGISVPALDWSAPGVWVGLREASTQKQQQAVWHQSRLAKRGAVVAMAGSRTDSARPQGPEFLTFC